MKYTRFTCLPIVLVSIFFSVHTAIGQTAVPFLRITPDARAASLGNCGVATPADVYSIYHNPSKTVFAKNKGGIGLSYIPMLNEQVNDIYLADLSAYLKADDKQAVAISGRYFSLGNLILTNSSGYTIEKYTPREYAANISYARKILPSLSLAINLGYVNSNLSSGQYVNNFPVKPSAAVFGGASALYSHKGKAGAFIKGYNIGLAISNFGNKMTYTVLPDEQDDLPRNIGLGTSLGFGKSKAHTFTWALDANKLMVPVSDTPTVKQRLQHTTLGSGIEYCFKEILFGRCGYYYEHLTTGNLQYLTAGIGGRHKFIGFDASYLVPISQSKNPLDYTFRYTLYFLIK